MPRLLKLEQNGMIFEHLPNICNCLSRIQLIFATFCDNRRILDPPLQAGNENQAKQRTEQRETTLKKTKSVPSAENVTTLVFWDAKGIFLINYLEKGKTITREQYQRYYASLLDSFTVGPLIQEKRETNYNVCYQQVVALLSLPMLFLNCCNHSNHIIAS